MSEAGPPSPRADHAPRCPWVRDIPEFLPYHDHEWGFPIADDARLFETMSLESFQSGLSWRTILNKRDAFRCAFENFRAEDVARFGQADVARLLADARIVRHRGKIEATIHNAKIVEDIQNRCGSLAAFVWRFEPAPSSRPTHPTREDVMAVAETDESRALSTALKRAGWRFFGPTTAYAFMQAAGLIDDHVESCWCRPRAEAARSVFVRPL